LKKLFILFVLLLSLPVLSQNIRQYNEIPFLSDSRNIPAPPVCYWDTTAHTWIIVSNIKPLPMANYQLAKSHLNFTGSLTHTVDTLSRHDTRRILNNTLKDSTFKIWWACSFIPDSAIEFSFDPAFPAYDITEVREGEPYTLEIQDVGSVQNLYLRKKAIGGNPIGYRFTSWGF
jgi:hypothetical protein